MLNTRMMLRVLSTVLVLGGAAACDCNGTTPGLRPDDGSNPNAGRLTITVVGQSSVKLAPNRDIPLTFLVALGGPQGTPIGGARVDFSLSANNGGALIGSDSLTTDDAGQVRVKLRAGPQNATFQVRASTEGAEQAVVDVDVDGRFAGNIVVRSGYNGPIVIARYEVRLHDARSGSTVQCDPNWPQGNLPNNLPPVVQKMDITDNVADARFVGLTERNKYIATVVGVNALNRPVAYGCGGPGEVVAQRDTVINVVLDTLEPNPQGKYDFGQDIEGLEFMDKTSTAYLALDNIVRFLSDPVTFMLEGAQIGPGEYVGGCTWIDDPALEGVCVSGLNTLLQPLLYRLLALETSGTATNVFDAIKNIASMVRTLRVGGTLEIKTYDRATGAITVEMKFNKIATAWNWNCARTSDGLLIDPCCGKDVQDGEELNLNPFQAVVKLPTGADATVFNGTLTRIPGAAKLSYAVNLDETYLSLMYGQLALALIEGALLPAVLTDTVRYPRDSAGRVTIERFLQGLMNCSGLAQNSFEQVACNAAGTAAQAILQQVAAGLRTTGSDDWNIKQQVTAATLVDEDLDLQTDTILGTFNMRLTGDGNSVTNAKAYPFRAAFAGGQECTGDASCASISPDLVCRFGRSPVDSCKAVNVCGVPDRGTKGVYESCGADAECRSGTCMNDPPPTVSATHLNRCFKACETDADCGGLGSCDVDGYKSAVSGGTFNSMTVAGTCVP